MIAGVIASQIVILMGPSWSYLGTTGTHTHTTSYTYLGGGCPSQAVAQSNLPAASGYVVDSVIRQTVYDDAVSVCATYYYQAV